MISLNEKRRSFRFSLVQTALILCCCCFLLTLQAIAQETAQNTAKERSKDDSADTPLVLDRQTQRIEWQALMLETELIKHPSPDKNAELLSLYEQFANRVCMPRLHVELKFEGGISNQSCSKAVKKLEKLDPDNPALLCIRDGIDAKSCKDAYEKQLILSAREFFQNAGIRPSEDKTVNPQIDARINKLKSSLTDVKRRFSGEQSEESRVDLNRNFASLFRLICRKSWVFRGENQNGLANDNPDLFSLSSSSDKLLLDGIIDQPTIDRPKAVDKNKANPMDSLLDKLNNGDRIDQVERVNNITDRRRVLNDDCLSYVEQLLRQDPVSDIGLCQREGFYTPACINAKRKIKIRARAIAEAKRKEEAKKNGVKIKPTRKPGLATF